MDPFHFNGKVAIITGAGRGLGRECARLLAARGAQVIVNDLGVGVNGDKTDEDPARLVAAQINASGGTAIANRGCVVNDSKLIIEEALDTFGRLDTLINNAGFGKFEGNNAFASMSMNQWDRMLETHLGGTVKMSHAAWPYLIKSGSGCIINMSSSAAFGAPSMPHYSTAKSAMIGLTRSLAAEGKQFGLRINAIMPTAFTRGTAQIPHAVLRDYFAVHFTSDHVASFLLWLAHESTQVSGECFSVGGGVACRVVLARGQSIKVSDKSPEAWAGESMHMINSGDMSIPLNSLDALCFDLSTVNVEGKNLADALRGKPSAYS